MKEMCLVLLSCEQKGHAVKILGSDTYLWRWDYSKNMRSPHSLFVECV